MRAISSKELHDTLSATLDRVVKDRERVIVAREGKPSAILLSLEDFNSFDETACLLSTPANADALRKSIEELEAGNGVERQLTFSELGTSTSMAETGAQPASRMPLRGKFAGHWSRRINEVMDSAELSERFPSVVGNFGQREEQGRGDRRNQKAECGAEYHCGDFTFVASPAPETEIIESQLPPADGAHNGAENDRKHQQAIHCSDHETWKIAHPCPPGPQVAMQTWG